MIKRNKRIQLIISAILCIAIAGAGSTMSYFRYRGEMRNELKFVGEYGLDGVLTEPGWDSEKGLLVLPGDIVTKDPRVTNTSEIDLDELAALQVEFIYGKNCSDQTKVGHLLSDEDMNKVVNVYQIDWNADIMGDWVRFDGETSEDQIQRFYYKTVLERNFPKKGETTIPLFTCLSIPKEVNNKLYSSIQAMGGFDIRISGIIVQQMCKETIHGLDTPQDAYKAGLFEFSKEDTTE